MPAFSRTSSTISPTWLDSQTTRSVSLDHTVSLSWPHGQSLDHTVSLSWPHGQSLLTTWSVSLGPHGLFSLLAIISWFIKIVTCLPLWRHIEFLRVFCCHSKIHLVCVRFSVIWRLLVWLFFCQSVGCMERPVCVCVCVSVCLSVCQERDV